MSNINKSFEDAYTEFVPYEPEYLYKYRSIRTKGLEEIFTRGEMFFTSPVMFNDPFDCRPRFVGSPKRKDIEAHLAKGIKYYHPEYSTKSIKQMIKKNFYSRKFDKNYLTKETYKNILSNTGIQCFSEVCDDILMWSHYSDSHTGICIQFKYSRDSSLFEDSIKVSYSSLYPELHVYENRNEYERIKALPTKSPHWEYEKKWRTIKFEQQGGPALYYFDRNLISAVILGAKISDKDEIKVRELASMLGENVNVLKATTNKKEFKLDIFSK